MRIYRSFPPSRNSLLQLDLLRSEFGALDLSIISPFIKLYVRLRISLVQSLSVQLSRLWKEPSVVSSTFFDGLGLVVKISALSWTIKVGDGLLKMTARICLA